MSSISPRQTQFLANPGDAPATFNRSEAKALSRATNQEVAKGLVAGTRLAAKGFATGLAIQQLGMLQREADFQATGDPRHDGRQQYLLDRFTEGAGHIIQNMG
ncbi:hypothetical protein HWD35_18985 [Tsukamurella tyrosinosolvens]|uniref:hypothetical protein n=1 Tax=Tsukamurella tyrosinosolvens TaxID=57704 RepID=UPI001CE14E0E|nr:hypothetical protein [Tsukamurella tyrosinosolvens]MCA4996805.1 hypothetical protein [Tsukamurella tyrosinosolvens]